MRTPEAYYRDLFAAQVDGETEVRVPFGRIDVVAYVNWTGEGHHRNGMPYRRHIGFVAVEVEPVESWRHGARQALAYSAQLKPKVKTDPRRHRPGIAVYGDLSASDIRKIHRRTHGLLELWVLDGSDWVHIEEPPDRPFQAIRLLEQVA